MRTTLSATICAAGCALTTFAATACSGTTHGVGGPRAHPVFPVAHTSAAHSPSAHPSPFPTAHASAEPTTSSPGAQRDVDRVLLTADQLGSGFVRAADAAPAALPCTPGAPPVDDQVAHVEKGNTVFVDDVAGVQVSEQVYVYRGVSDALRHEHVVHAGLACSRGSMQGAQVDITGPTDVGAQLPERHDSAEAWVVKTAQVTGVLVAVRIHAVVVQFAIVAEDGAKPDLDAQHVVEVGLKNILRAVAKG
jgi:hypothetical protein